MEVGMRPINMSCNNDHSGSPGFDPANVLNQLSIHLVTISFVRAGNNIVEELLSKS